MNREYGLFFPILMDEGAPINPGLMDSIDASLRTIFSWVWGKRYFNPAFGTKIPYMVNKGGTDINLYSIEKDVKNSIGTWEPRLTDVSVKVNLQDSEVFIRVEASITGLAHSTEVPRYEFETTI